MSTSLTSLRAVPDLTFSEVAFLNPRRSKQDVVAKPLPEKKRPRKDKAAVAEEEMSRFFTAKPTDPRGDVAWQDQKSRRPSPTSCIARGFEGTDRATAPFSPPVELPDLPFLGFGSSGMNPISPIKVTASGDAPCGMGTPSRPCSPARSSIASSSYYTWTATPSVKAHRRCGTDGTSGEVCRDSPKTRNANLSSVPHGQSGSRESASEKRHHIPNNDTEISQNSPENQDRNLNNAPPRRSDRSEEGQAEKSFYSGQRPQSGAAVRASSLSGRELTGGESADGEPADREPADREPADREPVERVLNQSLRKEVNDQPENECQGATKSDAKMQTENDFLLFFDKALERLIEACNIPSHQLKNPIDTSRTSKCRDQARSSDGLDSSSKSDNVGKLGRELAPNSQSINSCKEYSKNYLALQSPSSTITNHTIYSTMFPLGNDNGNHSTTLAHVTGGSESPTEAPARSILAQDTDLHRRGRRPPSEIQGIPSSDGWRGYRNTYHGQLLPDIEAGSHEYDISSGESIFERRGEIWPTYQNGFAEDISEDLQGIDEESLSHIPQNVQDRQKSYDDDTHYWQPNSHSLHDGTQHCRALGYGRRTGDLVETFSASSLATTKRRDIPEFRNSPDAMNMTTSAVSTGHFGDDESLGDSQQLDHEEPYDTRWAGFWRPNKLY